MPRVRSKIWIKDGCASHRKIVSDTLFLEVMTVFSKAASYALLSLETRVEELDSIVASNPQFLPTGGQTSSKLEIRTHLKV